MRIALDPKEIATNPLRVGLSMEATIDVRSEDDKTLTDASMAAPAAQTPVFADGDAGADDAVRRIIAANRAAPAKLRP